jgi:crotonobetainyl-CoA:carnitine CoA-transferase CaiB-like acyl-CoA transferase
MGEMPGVRCPLRMSGAEVGAVLAPPVLGEHTEEVLDKFVPANTG